MCTGLGPHTQGRVRGFPKPPIGLPGLANYYTECPIKFEKQQLIFYMLSVCHATFKTYIYLLKVFVVYLEFKFN